MNRTILDRSVLIARKEEERDLSEILYKKLLGLTLIHKPTNEFSEILTKDMFMKANPKALLHIMEFLLKLYLGAEEFKAKFFWPIIDKKSESLFRSSFVTYLMELNEKHNLNWAHLKNYLIAVPGGIKFITFLLELIDFIVGELIKKRENEFPEFKTLENRKLTKSTLNMEYEHFKQYAKEYEKKLDSFRIQIQQNTYILQTKLNEISLKTGIPTNQLTDKTLLNEFYTFNQELLQNLIIDKIETIKRCEKPLLDLKNLINTSYQTNLRKLSDNEKLIESFNEIQLSHPELKDKCILKNNEINYETFFSSLNCIIPNEIFKLFSTIEQKDLEYLKYEETELQCIARDLKDLEDETNDFEESLKCRKKIISIDGNNKTPAKTSSPSDILLGNFTLQTLYFNTPTISTNLSDNLIPDKKRLPFFNDFNLNDSVSSMRNDLDRYSNSLSYLNSTKKKNPIKSLQRPGNNSKNFDVSAQQFLKILTRSPLRKNSRFNLSLHGKENSQQSNFMPFKQKLNIPSSSSFDNESKGLQRHCLLSQQQQQNKDFQLSIIQKQQIKSIDNTPKISKIDYNIHEVSTSPSGRLDPVFSIPSSSSPLSSTIDHKNLTKIVIQEKSLIFEQSSTDNLFSKSIFEETKINIKTEQLSSPTEETIPMGILKENFDDNIKTQVENDETMKLCSEFNNKLNLIGNEDSINNISDTVLNDISS